jgi:peptidoglycan/LPS O-acetylase OafA/YrhL
MEKNVSLPASHRIQEIDGLRGIAVLSILVYHWVVQPLNWAPAWHNLRFGVDLFFVVSGFLIGRILLKTAQNFSEVLFFWVKRIFRIWPLYYLLLVAVLLIDGQKAFQGIPSWGFILFLYNFWEVSGHPLAFTKLGTIWSLAIEEQFYFLGPFIFFWIPPKKIERIAAVWVCAVPLLRLVSAVNGFHDLKFTFFRLDGIFVGIYISILLASDNNILLLSTKNKKLQLATFLLSSVSIACLQIPSIAELLGPTLVSISFGTLLTMILSQSYSNQSIHFFNSKILQYLGVRCYSIYLFHLFFMYITNGFIKNFLIGLIVQSLITILFAHIAWKYFEFPIMQFSKKIWLQRQNN